MKISRSKGHITISRAQVQKLLSQRRVPPMPLKEFAERGHSYRKDNVARSAVQEIPPEERDRLGRLVVAAVEGGFSATDLLLHEWMCALLHLGDPEIVRLIEGGPWVL